MDRWALISEHLELFVIAGSVVDSSPFFSLFDDLPNQDEKVLIIYYRSVVAIVLILVAKTLAEHPMIRILISEDCSSILILRAGLHKRHRLRVTPSVIKLPRPLHERSLLAK